MDGTPSIRIHSHSHDHRYHSPPPLSRHSPQHPLHAPASPMSIPHATQDSPSVPPPLPPPTNLYEDLTPQAQQKEWIFFNKEYVDQHWTDFGKAATVRPGSSLLGGNKSQEDGHVQHHEADASRRGSSMSTITAPHRNSEAMIDPCDNDDAKLSGYSERQLEQRSLSTSSQAYDRNLLSKIGGPNTPNRLSVSGGPETSGAVSPGPEPNAEHSARHLSTSSSSQSERRHPSVDSSTFRWSVSSAVSPGPFRNPNFNPENTRPTTLRHSSFQFDDSSSHRGSYDQSMFLNEEISTEEGQMKDLNLNDRDDFQLGAKPGMKRRASSPHRDSLREDRSSISSAPGSGDLYTRRSLQQQQYPNRNPSISASRYAPSHHGSISSASSYNPRHGSLASSYTLSVSSSATSYASGRISPGMMSPAIIDPELGAMGYMNAKPPNNQSPAPQHIMPPYTRTMSDTPLHNALHTPADSAPQSRHNSLPGVQGIFICDCCPKKPKKFTSEDDLSTNGATDTCGYCGDEFPNPADWNSRREHVLQTHKFGECNQTKKFYRADHFRQHLKHSHGGTSGKWTNMLETTCMRDEPLPQPMSMTANVQPAMPMMGMANTAGPPMGSNKPDVIAEMPHEA
ncbi:unnamed protein product [Aureobasidium uvarum]|uniref:C2H2-type zinc finger ascomycetes domain-containing protein n=1 Tax=Aureobasidium uvarum TaxID=2773716 RepID=A0A9N8KGB4_9PEZI|nr:unnamed protein product [Aureobasidium uvarum]